MQQCRTADGTALYTDKPCRAIGAQSVPMRGELATRLVHEQRAEARFTGVEVAFVTGSNAPTATTATMRAAREAIGRRSMPGGCARTTTQPRCRERRPIASRAARIVAVVAAGALVLETEGQLRAV